MLQKVIGVLLIAAAVYVFFNFTPCNAESRKSFKAMLISIVMGSSY